MTDLRNFNKQEFIELYRSHPCLWKIKSNEYTDRDKENKAYEDMIIKLQEVDDSATRESVKKKIDSLRGCFRKELKKVNASKKSGSSRNSLKRFTCENCLRLSNHSFAHFERFLFEYLFFIATAAATANIVVVSIFKLMKFMTRRCQ